MLEYLTTNLLNGLIAIVLLVGGYKVFDFITHRMDFYEELKKNNYSTAIVLFAFLIGLSIIISSAAY